MTTKGQDRGEVNTILFDEFLIREQYLKDEFVDFMNVVSSLIRDRDGAVIYCLANTVSKYSPYWKEFGIDGVETMEQGEIRVYQYGESELSLAIEYCADVSATDKVASKYFVLTTLKYVGKYSIATSAAKEYMMMILNIDFTLILMVICFAAR